MTNFYLLKKITGKSGIKLNWITIAVLLLAIANLLFPVINHYLFRTHAYDYAAYNFAFYDFAHLKISPNPVYIAPFPITFLQDHVSFTLLILSPLYWLLNPLIGTYSLIFIQWIFITAGAIYTFRFISEKYDKPVYGLLAVFCYYFMFFRFSSLSTDVNLAIMGSSLIPCWLYYFDKKNWKIFLLLTLFLLQNREDFSLWLIFLSIFSIVAAWSDKEKVKWGAITIGLSILYFFCTFQFIIPALEDENKKFYLFNYSALGDNPKEALSYLIHHPFNSIKQLFVNHIGDPYYDGVKSEFYLLFLLCGGFILFSRPLYLIPFIPLIAKKMWNDDPIRWSIESYYAIEIVSCLPILTFWVLSKWKGKKILPVITGVLIVFIVGTTLYKFNCGNHGIKYSDCSKVNVFSKAFYTSDYTIGRINSFINSIPANSKISASSSILPHLSFREYPYFYPRVDDAEYILLFTNNSFYPLSEEEFKVKLNELKNNESFVQIEEFDGFVAFKRK